MELIGGAVYIISSIVMGAALTVTEQMELGALLLASSFVAGYFVGRRTTRQQRGGRR